MKAAGLVALIGATAIVFFCLGMTAYQKGPMGNAMAGEAQLMKSVSRRFFNIDNRSRHEVFMETFVTYRTGGQQIAGKRRELQPKSHYTLDKFGVTLLANVAGDRTYNGNPDGFLLLLGGSKNGMNREVEAAVHIPIDWFRGSEEPMTVMVDDAGIHLQSESRRIDEPWHRLAQ